MTLKTFDELAEATTLAGTDKVAMWASAAAKTISVSNFILNSPNAGLVEKGAANTFTADQTFGEDIALDGLLKSDAALAIQHTNFSTTLDGQLKIRGTAANSISTMGFNCLIDTAGAGVFRNLGYVDFSLDDDSTGNDMQTSTRFATIVDGVEAERLIIDQNVLVKDTISSVLDGEFKIRGSFTDGATVATMGYSAGIAVSSGALKDMGYIDFALDEGGATLETSIRFATVMGGTKTETLILDKVGNLEITQAALKMHEMTAPLTAAIAAESVVIYAQSDATTGETELMAKFSSGTAVRLAIDD